MNFKFFKNGPHIHSYVTPCCSSARCVHQSICIYGPVNRDGPESSTGETDVPCKRPLTGSRTSPYNPLSPFGSPLLRARRASRWISENYAHPPVTEYIKILTSNSAPLCSESPQSVTCCLYLGLQVVVEAGVEKCRH